MLSCFPILHDDENTALTTAMCPPLTSSCGREREDVGEETVKYPGVKIGFVVIATLKAILKRSLK